MRQNPSLPVVGVAYDLSPDVTHLASDEEPQSIVEIRVEALQRLEGLQEEDRVIDGVLQLAFDLVALLFCQQGVARPARLPGLDFAALLTSVDLAQLTNTLALIRRQVALAHEAVDVFGGAPQLALLQAGTHIFLLLLATLDLTLGNGAVVEGVPDAVLDADSARRDA